MQLDCRESATCTALSSFRKLFLIMRLINAKTLEIESFLLKKKPKYAILSHRWGEEPSYQDMLNGKASSKDGYFKITQACKLALDHGLSYAWVDTCCIDKTSSAELSQSINSMYLWYKEAEICFAFLSDLKPSMPDKSIAASQWWTRGWTLQEVIAPKVVEFLDSDWRPRGSRTSHARMIADETNIDYGILTGSIDVKDKSIAERMSWASKRQTTLPEDQAYSLLGIFGVNMPLIYGEGKNAFRRLVQAVIERDNDLSVLAFELPIPSALSELFATNPKYYAGQRKTRGTRDDCDFVSSNKGLKFGHGFLHRIKDVSGRYRIVMKVGNRVNRDDRGFSMMHICVPLIQAAPNVFKRERDQPLVKISERDAKPPKMMMLPIHAFYITSTAYRGDRYLRITSLDVTDAMPSLQWEWNTSTFFKDERYVRHHDVVFALRLVLKNGIELGLFCDFRQKEPKVFATDNSLSVLDRIFEFAGGRRKEQSLSWYELEAQHPTLFSGCLKDQVRYGNDQFVAAFLIRHNIEGFEGRNGMFTPWEIQLKFSPA